MAATPQQIVLFGASKAGEFFLSQNPHLPVVAFVDNDINRHGTSLAGLPVLAPEALQQLDDATIIITSQWVDAISAQLQKIGIPAERIVMPTKQQLKSGLPFQHPATLALAHSLLQRLNTFLQQHGIRPCLDSGTLLGVIRQRALIPWDDDIDLAIDVAEFDVLKRCITDFASQLPAQDLLNWQIILLRVNQQDCCINLEFTPKPGADMVPFDVSLQMRQVQGEHSELVSSAGLFFAPARHFSRYANITFLGQHFYIPDDAEGFLSFMYGNWKEPQKGTRITEYHNRRAQLPVEKTQVQVQKRLLYGA